MKDGREEEQGWGSFPLSRRQWIKTVVSGATVCILQGCVPSFRLSQRNPSFDSQALKRLSPIDRSIPIPAPVTFYGDNPDRVHLLLRDQAVQKQDFQNIPFERARVVVVGGGVSGLSAAYRLRQYRPILLEQAARFGGNSQGHSWEGLDSPIGAAYFIHAEPDVDLGPFYRELGVYENAKVVEGGETYLYHSQQLTDLWDGSAILTPQQLKIVAKLKKYFRSVLGESDGEIYPYIPLKPGARYKEYVKKLDRVSFKAFLEKKISSRLPPIIETAIEAYCASSFGASASEVSAACGLNAYSAEFGKMFVMPGGNAGMAELIYQKLTQSLPEEHFRARSIVTSVKTNQEGVELCYWDENQKPRKIQAETMILACPKFVVKRILSNLEPSRLESIEKIRYRSYLVASVFLKQGYKNQPPFYDLYLLDEKANPPFRQVTDVVLGNYAQLDSERSILNFYRSFPYEGARGEILVPGAYDRFKKEFEKQIFQEIFPALKLRRDQIVDFRLTRWGHALPLGSPGFIANGHAERVRKPFHGRVFFAHQDNWALPAFETGVEDALHWASQIEKILTPAVELTSS